MEAEEIARLAVDLERAVRAGKTEADKRQQVEERLAAAEARLSDWETGAVETRSSHSKRSKSPSPRSPRATGGRGRGRGESGERKGARRRSVHVLPEETCDEDCNSSHPQRGAMGSTIASRGRSFHDRPAAAGSNGHPCGMKGKGKGRASVSPRRNKNAEAKGQRRAWGSDRKSVV